MESIILSSGTVVTPEDIKKIASAVNGLLQTTSKDPGQYEEAKSLQGISSLPVFRQSGSAYELVRVAVTLLKGMDGKQIVLQVTADYIQWRYENGNWQNLMPISDLQKPAQDMIDKVGAVEKNATAALNTANTANQTAIAANKTAQQTIQAAGDAADLANEKAEEAVVAAGNANLAANTANEKAGLAESAAESAGAAATDVEQAIARLEELEDTLTGKDRKQPTAMELDYPDVIRFGSPADPRIRATLSPAGTGRNVLFLSDDKAVSVLPDGFIQANAYGKSRVFVIPTENTAIYRIIEIEVTGESIRKLSGSAMRLTAGGNIRFN